MGNRILVGPVIRSDVATFSMTFCPITEGDPKTQNTSYTRSPIRVSPAARKLRSPTNCRTSYGGGNETRHHNLVRPRQVANLSFCSTFYVILKYNTSA